MNQQPRLGNDGWKTKGCEVWLPPFILLIPDTGKFVMEPRKWHTLQLSSRNVGGLTTYQAAINDTELCNFDLVVPFRANTGGPFLAVRNAEVHFDNVVIADESIPDMDVNDFVGALSVSHGDNLATTWGELKQRR